jgi:hypothetical protein
MRRHLAAIASIGLCGAVLEPVVRAPDDPDSDGFPLSTYPMFAAPRPAELTMAWARGVAPGRRRALSPRHAGTGEVMQAFATIQRAAGGAPEDRAALCRAIAARIAGDAGLGDVVEIELVIGTYDAVRWLAGDPAAAPEPTPGSSGEAVVARCPVARGAQAAAAR